MKKSIHIISPKKQQKGICRLNPVYSIFNMSLCRQPKYKIICQKSPRSSEFSLTNSGQKSLTRFISPRVNNHSIEC